MREIVTTLVDYQIAWLASSPRNATIFVTVLDCLLVYAVALGARKKASQNELLIMALAVVAIVATVLEFVGGSR